MTPPNTRNRNTGETDDFDDWDDDPPELDFDRLPELDGAELDVPEIDDEPEPDDRDFCFDDEEE